MFEKKSENIASSVKNENIILEDELKSKFEEASGNIDDFKTELETTDKIVEEFKTNPAPVLNIQNETLMTKQDDANSDDWEDLNESQELQKITSLEERSQNVTDKLLELQVKHKEISDRVHSVLLETVDIAMGSSTNLKEHIRRNQKAAAKIDSTSNAESLKKKKPHKSSLLLDDEDEIELLEFRKAEREKLKYVQGVGSVPYGLPCLAVTRRTT